MKNNEAAVTLVVGLGEVGKPLFAILKRAGAGSHWYRHQTCAGGSAGRNSPHLFSVYQRDQFRSAVEGNELGSLPA